LNYDFLEDNKKFWITAIALASAILFFALAFSTLNDWIKFGLIVLELGASGVLLGRLSGQEHFYGVILVRGVAGFKEMRYVSKHYAQLSKDLADFGLTLGYGVFYGLHLYGLGKKLLLHFAGLLVFYALFLLQPTLVDGLLMAAIGTVTGLFGIGFYFIASHAYAVLTIPATPPGVIPIVPGVTVPWEVVFALIIVAVVHELAHGVLCIVEKMKVKSSGVLLFGILPVGAFVEPDEKQLEKADVHKQRRILGAGSTSNALFFVVFLLFAVALGQALPLFVQSVSVKSVLANSTASQILTPGEVVYSVEVFGESLGDAYRVSEVEFKTAEQLALVVYQKGFMILNTSGGSEKQVRAIQLEVASSSNPALAKGDVIYWIGESPIYVHSDVKAALGSKTAGESVIVETNTGEKTVQLNSEGKLGITVLSKQAVEFQSNPFNPFLFGLFYFLLTVISFTMALNFILATINLLPLFLLPTDGQRIFLVELRNSFGRKNGTKLAVAIGVLCLGLLVINALPWFIKTLPWLA